MVRSIVKTGTTAAGKAWTHYKEDWGNDTANWIIGDDTEAADTDIPGFLYCHGSTGPADQMLRVQFSKWLPNIEAVIDNGGLIAESAGSGTLTGRYNGQTHWGRPFVRLARIELAHLVMGYHDVIDWTPIGRSMGGLDSKQLALNPGDLNIRGLIDVSGVYSMMRHFDRGNQFSLPDTWNVADPAPRPVYPEGDPNAGKVKPYDAADPDWIAWKNDSQTVASRLALLNATDGYDPERLSLAPLADKHICIISGTADVTVPPTIAANRFDADLHGIAIGSKSKTYSITGATHDLDGGTYGRPEVTAFIKDILGAGPSDDPLPGVPTLTYIADRTYIEKPGNPRMLIPITQAYL